MTNETGPVESPDRIASPLVVDARCLAAMLGVSERQINRLDSGGKIPASIALGRCKRWSVEEIRSWIAAGAPARSRWILRSPVGGARGTGQ